MQIAVRVCEADMPYLNNRSKEHKMDSFTMNDMFIGIRNFMPILVPCFQVFTYEQCP